MKSRDRREIRDTFSMFDRSNKNRLEFCDLKPAMMALGFDFSPEDKESMLYNMTKTESDKKYLN